MTPLIDYRVDVVRVGPTRRPVLSSRSTTTIREKWFRCRNRISSTARFRKVIAVGCLPVMSEEVARFLLLVLLCLECSSPCGGGVVD